MTTRRVVLQSLSALLLPFVVIATYALVARAMTLAGYVVVIDIATARLAVTAAGIMTAAVTAAIIGGYPSWSVFYRSWLRMSPSAAAYAFSPAAAILRRCEGMAVWEFMIDVVANAIAPVRLLRRL
jgi:hypothetical protein